VKEKQRTPNSTLAICWGSCKLQAQFSAV